MLCITCLQRGFAAQRKRICSSGAEEKGESSWPGVWVPCSANRKRPFLASVLLRQRVAGTTIMKSPLAPDEFSGKNKVLLKCRDYQISCSVPKTEKWSRHTASGHDTVLALCIFITISHYYVFTYLFIHLCLVSVFLWADETQFLCFCPGELQSWFIQFPFRSRIQHFSGFSFFVQDTGFKCSHILLPHPFEVWICGFLPGTVPVVDSSRATIRVAFALGTELINCVVHWSVRSYLEGPSLLGETSWI